MSLSINPSNQGLKLDHPTQSFLALCVSIHQSIKSRVETTVSLLLVTICPKSLSINPSNQGLKLECAHHLVDTVRVSIHQSIKSRVETILMGVTCRRWHCVSIHQSIKSRVETSLLYLPAQQSLAVSIHQSIKSRVETCGKIQNDPVQPCLYPSIHQIKG